MVNSGDPAGLDLASSSQSSRTVTEKDNTPVDSSQSSIYVPPSKLRYSNVSDFLSDKEVEEEKEHHVLDSATTSCGKQ